MGRGIMVTTIIVIAIAISMTQLASGQVCGANISGLMTECQRYLNSARPNSPPPSRSCCALIRPIDVPCACRYVSNDVMNYIDMNKAVYLARSCGKKIPAGYKCGSYTIPAA